MPTVEEVYTYLAGPNSFYVGHIGEFYPYPDRTKFAQVELIDLMLINTFQKDTYAFAARFHRNQWHHTRVLAVPIDRALQYLLIHGIRFIAPHSWEKK